jgi:hypothetical protein
MVEFIKTKSGKKELIRKKIKPPKLIGGNIFIYRYFTGNLLSHF